MRASEADPGGMRLEALFEEQVRRGPSRVAVETTAGVRLTYAELDARAEQLAAAIKTATDAATPAPLIVARRAALDWVIAALASWKAGHVYVPVLPDAPEDRARRTVARCGARAVIADDPALPWACGLAPIVAAGGAEVAEPEERERTEQDDAYIVFTSGSTGEPKGVAVPHAALAATTCARLSADAPAPAAIALAFPPTFDSWLGVLVWALAGGGCVVVSATGYALDFDELFACVESARVTQLDLIPATYEALLARCSPEAIRRLGVVFVGGEPCTARLAKRHHRVAPDVPLFQDYGVTEAGDRSTLHRVDPRDADPIPAGRPLDGVRLHVLDAELRPVEAGRVGEIYIGGPALARGYVGAPRATAARFVPDPWSAEPAARMYATGDRGRLDRDGALRLAGRADHQVKVRGNRVELGEVERALEQVVGSNRSAAVAVPDGAGSHVLHAFVAAPDGALDAASIVAALRPAIPPYMIPSAWHGLPELTRSVNGKVDRAALLRRAQASGAAPAAGATAAADHPALVEACEVFSAALGIAVGPDEGLWDAGGSSQTAIRIAAAISDRFAVDCSLRAVYANPSPGALVRALRLDAGATATGGEGQQ